MDDWLESFPDVDEQEKREFVPPTITDGKPEITEAQVRGTQFSTTINPVVVSFL